MDLSIAIELCKRFEGFRSKPYLCPAGVATIGYGSTHYANGSKVTLADSPISEPDAHRLLVHELLNRYSASIIRLCPSLLPLAILEEDWRKFSALADFVYNLGAGRLQTSTLRRRINAGDWEGAQRELMKWVYGGGKKLPGLIKRRTAEVKLFN